MKCWLAIAVPSLFVVPAASFLPPSRAGYSSSSAMYNIFDDLKLIMSEKGQANIKKYNEQERSEQQRAQEEILERRRNPQKMKNYMSKKNQNRQKLQEERDIWEFQNRQQTGFDPLKQWNKLRQEGKIKVGSDLERDASSSRLGSEGLVDVRVDERMPYIDQGYVDEDADVMGNFMKLFGGGKKK